eukprot:4425303-Pleurochrysis_carterae.AAC.1
MKSQRRMDNRSLAAMAARTRKEVARMVEQNTQMRRTRLRSEGTSLRSMTSQLPFCWWFAISARSAAVHPARSRASACLRVLGSLVAGDTVYAHPEPLLQWGAWCALRVVNSADGSRLRRG